MLIASLAATPAGAAPSELDAIVAIVDESVITRRELSARIDLVKVEFEEQRRKLPPTDVLQRQVLEVLIKDSLMLQEAERRGIRVTEGQLNQTMQRLARQNNVSLADYRNALIRRGLDYEKYRETVRRELTISTLARQFGQSASVALERSTIDRLVAVDPFQDPFLGDPEVRVPPNVERFWEYRHSNSPAGDCSSGELLGPYEGIPPICTASTDCIDYDYSLNPNETYNGWPGSMVGHCTILDAAHPAIAHNVSEGQDYGDTPSTVPVTIE